MSRIGKKPIILQAGVSAKIVDGVCHLESSLGKISVPIEADLLCSIENNTITLELKGSSKHAKAMWGTTRALLANAVAGLHKPFSTTLELKGIGYKAKLDGKKINLALGFTPFDVNIPEGLNVTCPTATQVVVSGISKQAVGAFSSTIRAFKKPGLYHGEGVRYLGEKIVLRAVSKK